jgi:hypothetical protein
MPSATRPVIAGLAGLARLTTARSTCDGFPGTTRSAYAVCPTSATAVTSPASSPIVLGKRGVVRSTTFIPRLRPLTTAILPAAAIRCP